jgi:hypothetical protein
MRGAEHVLNDQDLGFSPDQGGDRVLQDFLAGMIGPVVEDVPEDVEASA